MYDGMWMWMELVLLILLMLVRYLLWGRTDTHNTHARNSMLIWHGQLKALARTWTYDWQHGHWLWLMHAHTEAIEFVSTENWVWNALSLRYIFLYVGLYSILTSSDLDLWTRFKNSIYLKDSRSLSLSFCVELGLMFVYYYEVIFCNYLTFLSLCVGISIWT
jgi:hypothetical protein